MASELNIDTKFLRNLEKVDESLQKIVKSTNDATAAFEEMLRKTDSFDIIAKLQSNLSKLVGKKVEIDVDGKNVKSISETMDRLVEQVKSLAGTDLFDTSKIYENEKGIVALESHIANINKVIKDLKKNIGNIDAEKYVSAPFVQTTQFVAPINPRTQKEYGKNTNAYRNAYSNYEEEVAKEREAYEERERLEEEIFNRVKESRKRNIENAMHALIEKKAIATEELEWQKMTFAERLEYTQSSLNKILKAEKKNVDDVRKEYKQLLAEQIDIMSKRQKLEGYEDSREKQAAEKEYDIQFERRNARRIEIEREYGDSVVDIAENAQRKILDLEMARIKKAEEAEFERYATSPSGALNLASKATTINQMKDAQKYIQAARANVDVSDTETIKKLNDEYTRLRMTIENLTTAEKNEQTLQPTLKNEYARLLVELDKIASAKEKVSKTSAFRNGDAASVRSMSALLEREKDIREKMSKIEESAKVKTKERIELEKELASWTAKRAEAGRKQETSEYALADEKVKEIERNLSLMDGYESALDDVVRKHEAARAMESIALTEKTERERAEIANRILKERLAESSKYGSISSDSANRMIRATDNSQNVAEEERAIKKLEEARKNLNKNDVDYQETLERLNKKIAEHTHNIKMATDAQYAENQAKKQAREVNTTYDGALDFSRNTQSINEQIQAIKYLKEAREKLNKNDFGSENEYKKAVKDITDEINRQKESLDELEGKTKKTNSELSTLSRRLIAAFSINAISNYVSKVVQLRGEFALQKKALSAIVQDQKAANKLWEQTISLALKSPYRVKQLVTYTKQLAAYRIETEKLHDTTKMLADVSAGLGVDMERLILAYGQVKAANYLRGTELRQFSEAGINILGELATYFEETRGKAFSVAEVFEMVSKRAVKFEDVDEVFKRLTGSSGIFFKMQEKQAETVAGQLSNLRDAYEIMLNDIGKQNEGTIISVISSARFIISHWEGIATIVKPILEMLVVGMAAWRVQMLRNSETIKTFGLYMKQFYILVTKGKKAMVDFSKASNISKFAPFTLAIGAAVVALGHLISNINKYNQAISEINKKHDEAVRQINELNMEFIQASKQQNPYKAQIDALKKLISLAEKKYKMNIEVDISKLNQEDIEKTFNDIRSRMSSDELFISSAMKTFSNREHVRFNLFGDEIVDDVKDFSDALQYYNEIIVNNQSEIISSLKDNYNDLTEAEKKALEELSKGFDSSAESQEEYLQRVGNILGKLRKQEQERLDFSYNNSTYEEYKKLSSEIANIWGITYTRIGMGFDTLIHQTKEAKKEWYEYIKKVQGLEGLPKDELERKLKLVISETQLRNEWNDNVVRNINAWTEEYYREQKGITIKLNVPQVTTMDNVLSSWQEEYNRKFKDYYGFQKISNVDVTREDLITTLDEEYKKLKAERDRFKSRDTSIADLYEDFDIVGATKKLAELKAQLNALRGNDDKLKKGGDSQKDWYSEMAKSIRDAHKNFISLNEDLGDAEALTEAIKRNTGAFSEAAKNAKLDVSLKDFSNFDTEEGSIGALNKLLEMIPKNAKNARINIQKMIGDITSEDIVNNAKESFDDLSRQFEKMFENYRLTIELKDAGFNSDFLETFFNIPNVTTENIRDEIKKMLGDSAKEISNDKSLIDAINKSTLSDKIKKLLLDNLSKVTKEEGNALQKRLKQYIDYTKESLSEISKIRLDEARELQSVTDVINAEIKRVGKDTEEGKRLVGILETLRKSIKRNADEDAQKAEWENFKGSDMYTMMFEDIEYFGTKALGVLKTKLEEFKSSLKDLPVSDVKEIISQIEKIEGVMIDRNPFKLLRETKTDLKKLPSEEKLQQQFADSSAKVDEYQQELDAINAIIAAKNTILNTDKKTEDNIKSSAEAERTLSEYTKKYGDYTQKSVTELNQRKAALEENLNKEKGIAETSRKGLDLYKKSREEYASAANKAQQMGQQVDNAFSATRDILSAVGVESDSVAGTLLEAGQNMTSLIFSAIQMQLQFKAMGVAANSALGVIGWIATALQVVAQLFTALFSIHDKKREKQIQKELDLVKKLEKEYKKLEKAMDEAYSVDAMKSSYDEAQKNLDAQIASYEKIIQLEKDKKKTDNDKLEEYQDKLEELREQKEELKREKVEDFGGNYDFRSVTREFVDAWLDAFRETGIGIDGLDEKFKELMQNIVVEQAVMTGASKILQPMLDSINKSLEDDFVLDSDELSSIEELNEDARLRLDQFLKSLFGEGGVFSDYVNTEANGELDGLQKGIQGITEETAQIIEGYLNSIRFFVSEKYNLLSNFVSSFTNTEMENPIISQLKIIAVQTTSINTLLNSLTAPHPTQDGFGIKVVI